jgi:hypothetical protein
MPKPVNINARSSTITNSFINSIIPVIYPSTAEIADALEVLEMIPGDVRCAYCGDPFTEWDHLRPLVDKQRPTGYISEISNLVPACGKCNQSKGNKPWRQWIVSSAPRSPKSRDIPDLLLKIRRLEAYEKWQPVSPIDFGSIVGSQLWDQHWHNWKKLLEQMKESQIVAEKIRLKIREAHQPELA